MTLIAVQHPPSGGFHIGATDVKTPFGGFSVMGRPVGYRRLDVPSDLPNLTVQRSPTSNVQRVAPTQGQAAKTFASRFQSLQLFAARLNRQVMFTLAAAVALPIALTAVAVSWLNTNIQLNTILPKAVREGSENIKNRLIAGLSTLIMVLPTTHFYIDAANAVGYQEGRKAVPDQTIRSVYNSLNALFNGSLSDARDILLDLSLGPRVRTVQNASGLPN